MTKTMTKIITGHYDCYNDLDNVTTKLPLDITLKMSIIMTKTMTGHYDHHNDPANVPNNDL